MGAATAGNPPGDSSIEVRPFNARSALLSTLLGTEPPRLPVSRLVRAVELFGIAEGTARTALSRMVSRGEVRRDGDGWYELTGAMLVRHRRQTASREGERVEWNGRWRQAVVRAEPRGAADRAALRQAMRLLRFAELREGVWMRPDNLPADRLPEVWYAPRTQCDWASVYPDDDSAEVAARLWDLDAWVAESNALRRQMSEVRASVEAREPGRLAEGFMISATVLRQFQADPLLPPELLPRDWPGSRLRSDYDQFDALVRAFLRDHLAVKG